MIRRYIIMLVLSLLCTTAFSEDWLSGGYVGSPNYGEVRQYFTDPIFYSGLPVSQPIGIYETYNAIPNFKQPLYLENMHPDTYEIISKVVLR
ncbi:MAG: hypothetical protein MUO26_14615 [Methanotrichaceae archaeon]|nr:hypothetical protein [Methanotrichaceae archaeon]